MSKKQQTLKELQKVWYDKLKDTGFKDIEKDEYLLHHWSSLLSLRYDHDYISARQEYYIMAEHFLNDYKFENKIEEAMWNYHVEGISYRNISKLLKPLGIKLTHTSVQTRIHKLRTAMFLMYKMNKENYDEQ